MSDSEQLFSPKEMLDALDQVYLGAMCSESVLTFDGKRYGFGHESFYDYCFARKFVANGQSLCEVLKEGSQGLFVRSMVRQVLVYMRDYDFPTYIQQVDSLLSDDHIRIHIKDLVLALLASVPEPTLVEWKLFAARVDRFFELASARSQYGTLEALVWHHFFLSTKLFDVAYSQGELRRWLGSVDDHAINILIHYFYYEQRHHAEEIAELLEPYVGVNPVWDDRVRRVMEGASSGDSRRSFDLFLKLLELGVLDSARDRWISNGTFWSMCSSWSDSRPDWLAELIARWLARRLQLFLDPGRSTCQPAWRGFLENESDVKHILMEVAQKAPAEYVKYVLPVVLQIIEEAVVKGSDELPRVDYVEMIYHVSESSMTQAS